MLLENLVCETHSACRPMPLFEKPIEFLGTKENYENDCDKAILGFHDDTLQHVDGLLGICTVDFRQSIQNVSLLIDAHGEKE